jgi:Fic family protein
MLNTNTIQIDQEILQIIAEIDEFKGSWKALGLLAPDRLSMLRKVASIESIGSSTRIEGSKLSDRDVEKLLSNLEIKSFETRDEQEVAGYSLVMELVFQSWDEITLTENHIKQLHRDLLKFTHKDESHRGHYKKVNNSVAAFDENGIQIGVIFETATPFDTPYLMGELVDSVNSIIATKKLHPLLIVAIFIVVFLEIHPFQDGNGRLSRVLTTLLLLRFSYAYVPYSSLESVIEHSKEQYYLALRKTQGTIRTNKPNWQPWIRFFLKSLQQQMRKLERKIQKEKIMMESLPEISLKILDHIKQHGRVTIGEMAKLTGLNRNTLKEHFRSLTEKGHISLHGSGRGSWYSM